MTVVPMDAKKRRKKKKKIQKIQQYPAAVPVQKGKNAPADEKQVKASGQAEASGERTAEQKIPKEPQKPEKEAPKATKAAEAVDEGADKAGKQTKERGTEKEKGGNKKGRIIKMEPEQIRKKKKKKKKKTKTKTKDRADGAREKKKKSKKKKAPKQRKEEAKKNRKSDFISGPFASLRSGRKVTLDGERRVRFGRHRSLGLILAAVLGTLLVVVLATGFFISRHYHVNKVYVEGNTHYTNEEIKAFVTQGRFGSNSLYLSYKYGKKGIENIPFISKMEIQVLSADSIKITVYEKAVAGYVEYLDHAMYFDKDGIVVESVDEPTGNAPQVIGLDFDHVVLHEKLPVENDAVFAEILEVTQLMKKYAVEADKIYFNSNSEMTLYFGKARVALGSMNGIDEKIMKLKALLPKLEGLEGVLRMENYSEDSKLITFQQD